MRKAVRIKLPANKPKETIELSEFIIAKHTAMGAGSPLTGIINMTAFGNLTTDARDKRKQADLKDRAAQDKFDEASVKAGTAKGQTKDTKDTVVWYIRQIRDLLLVIHNGQEEALSEYGFNVVITQTGSRKHVRVDIPAKADTVVELAQDIIEQHTTLGAGSPLTAALVNMTIFETLTNDTDTLLSEWTVLRGEVQALNNDAITTIGYAPGQTSTTIGTIYNELTKIRTRLLQNHQGREEALSNWGFNVKISKFSKKKASSGISIKGEVTDSETGNPIANALVHLVEPDIFTLTDDNGNFEYEKIAAGTYTIQAHKTGYEDFESTEVVVTAGAVTTFNIELQPEAATGSISGTVTKTGLPAQATITIMNVAGSTSTNPSGEYLKDNVPAGTHSVRATLVDNPSEFIDQPANVPEGGNVVVNFSFP